MDNLPSNMDLDCHDFDHEERSQLSRGSTDCSESSNKEVQNNDAPNPNEIYSEDQKYHSKSQTTFRSENNSEDCTDTLRENSVTEGRAIETSNKLDHQEVLSPRSIDAGKSMNIENSDEDTHIPQEIPQDIPKIFR